MTQYSTEPRTRKDVKEYGFFSFARNLCNKYGKQLLDTATNTGLDAPKTASKKVVHKAAEATGEVIGNKISYKTVKLDKNSKDVKKTIIPLEKREKILNKLRQVL